MTAHSRFVSRAVTRAAVLAVGSACFVPGPGTSGDTDPTETTGFTDPTDTTDGEPSFGAVSFGQDVYPLLQAHCSGCHSPVGMASLTRLVFTGVQEDDYAMVSELVSATSPEQSTLLSKAAGTEHLGGTTLDAESSAYAVLQAWVEQGAANN